MKTGDWIGLGITLILLSPFFVWVIAWFLHILIVSVRHAGEVIKEAWDY